MAKIQRTRYQTDYICVEIENGVRGANADIPIDTTGRNAIIQNLLLNDARTIGIEKKTWSTHIRKTRFIKQATVKFTHDPAPLYPRPCTVPKWVGEMSKDNREVHQQWHATLCFCHANLRGMAHSNKLTTLEKLTTNLVPLHQHIQDDKFANSSKTAFCLFHRALVPSYENEDKIWTSSHFVLIGDDVQISKDVGHHKGFGRLCKFGLAMLLGKWEEDGSSGIQRHDEKAFSLHFYHSCIEPLAKGAAGTTCLPRQSQSITVAKWYKNWYKKAMLNNLILEVAIRCIIMQEGYVPTGDVYMPRSPPKDKVLSHWNAGNLLPSTKSIVLSKATFQASSKVLDILGSEDNNQVRNMQIADYRLHYISPQGKSTNRCIDVTSWRAYLGKMPFIAEAPKVNVLVTRAKPALREKLCAIAKLDTIIPRRGNEHWHSEICGQLMLPYHKGITNFFQASWKMTELAQDAFNEMFTEEKEVDKARQMLGEMINADMLRALLDEELKDWDFDGDPRFLVFRCDFRQCRFSTNYHERVAPHLEFGHGIPKILQDSGCRVVTCIVPIHELGVWVRLFFNKHDRHGVLVKVMHGTALLFESSQMPIELGRCTHHEGNPYFAFHVLLYGEKSNTDLVEKALDALNKPSENVREYVHFPKTYQETGEEGMRIVTPNKFSEHPLLVGKKKQWKDPWSSWESETSTALEDYCAC